MLLIALCFIATGIIVGILSGLFGMGGGLTIVPIMVLFISIYDPAFIGQSMHIAIATSLFVMIFTTVITTYTHHKSGNIMWKVVIPLKLGVIIGSILGAVSASFLSSNLLKIFFIAFLIYTIIKWAVKSLSKRKSSSERSPLPVLPSNRLSIVYGCITGAIAVLLGIGSSVMMVPFLKHKNFSMTNAAAIAAAVTPFIALLGSLTYIYVGFDMHLPKYSLGYVYIPAALGMIFGAFIGAPIGTILSSKIPQSIQNTIYFCFLVIILIVMSI